MKIEQIENTDFLNSLSTALFSDYASATVKTALLMSSGKPDEHDLSVYDSQSCDISTEKITEELFSEPVKGILIDANVMLSGKNLKIIQVIAYTVDELALTRRVCLSKKALIVTIGEGDRFFIIPGDDGTDIKELSSNSWWLLDSDSNPFYFFNGSQSGDRKIIICELEEIV